ncbi:hypothetical protein FPZ41_31865 [Streptomyces sp. K1PN6]|uniref:Uncharacterized protein n=1 Tax=Streptomyces acidicola TaxID=2596892 RepID=A0A5N8WZV7_9ACTN|nr:hypothetical protein [Streptomyces acidicola]
MSLARPKPHPRPTPARGARYGTAHHHCRNDDFTTAPPLVLRSDTDGRRAEPAPLTAEFCPRISQNGRVPNKDPSSRHPFE